MFDAIAARLIRCTASMLDRPRLFHTERALRLLEGPARSNIARALAGLREGLSH